MYYASSGSLLEYIVHKCHKYYEAIAAVSELFYSWAPLFYRIFEEIENSKIFRRVDWVSKLNSEKCLVLYLNNCHLFMYLQRMVQWDCVIKLHDNRIFKTFLRIKKSFKSIDLDLPKHPLEFVWKISNLKIKLSLLGTKSRKRLTRKRLQTAEERNTAENQGKTYPRKQTSS